MSRVVDGVLKDWGDRYEVGRVKGRGNKNARKGPAKASPQRPPILGPATKEKISRTVKKAPEVMVKISGGGKNMRQIKAHMDYISRNGDVELEDENGHVFNGKEDVRDVRNAWAKGKIGIPEEGEARKEAFNIVLSMPPGTPRQAVKDAARAFAAQQFSTHQYVFAAHDDEKHPHVHLAVKAMSKEGVRLNPRKADLQNWREVFAEKLREHGVEANATPRKARGVVQKAEKQAVRHMEKTGRRSRVKAAQRKAVEREVAGEGAHVNPASDKIKASRKDAHKAYGAVAKVLAAGDIDDKRLALDVVAFIKDLPPLLTQHEAAVQQSRKAKTLKAKDQDRSPGERSQGEREADRE